MLFHALADEVLDAVSTMMESVPSVMPPMIGAAQPLRPDAKTTSTETCAIDRSLIPYTPAGCASLPHFMPLVLMVFAGFNPVGASLPKILLLAAH